MVKGTFRFGFTPSQWLPEHTLKSVWMWSSQAGIFHIVALLIQIFLATGARDCATLELSVARDDTVCCRCPRFSLLLNACSRMTREGYKQLVYVCVYKSLNQHMFLQLVCGEQMAIRHPPRSAHLWCGSARLCQTVCVWPTSEVFYRQDTVWGVESCFFIYCLCL